MSAGASTVPEGGAGPRAPGDADLERLADRLGTDRVSLREETLERYAADESTRLRALPYAVVRPVSAGEVVAQIRGWYR